MKKLLLFLLIAVCINSISQAAPFTPGNIVIYRIGTGTGSLSSNATAAFIDEYTPAGALVQSIALPTTASSPNFALTSSGTATSEGLISLSADGNYLLAIGYNAVVGTTGLSSSSSSTINRVVGIIDPNGTVNTTTALSDASTGNNVRSVASSDGNLLWVTGGAGGIRYTTKGSTTSTQLSTTTVNLRQAFILNKQLYVSSSSGATRIATVGSGLPTTSGQTITNLNGITSTNTPSPYQFYFADVSAAVPGPDVLYVADDATGLIKYSFVSGAWTSNGVVGTSSDAYRGITGVVNGSTVTLYATRKGGSGSTGGGEFVTISDNSGYNGTFSGTPTSLVTAPTNTVFRGIAFAPITPVSISSQPSSQTKCSGDNVQFSVTAAGGETPYTYQWNENGVALSTSSTYSGVTSATLTINSISAGLSGNKYTCFVTNVAPVGSDTITSNAATLTVNSTPAQPSSFTTSSASVCSGTTGIAYAIPAVSGATSYSWSYDGNNAIINGSTEAITVDFASNATSGNLSVTASNACGASTALTTPITINSTPAQPSGFTTSTTTVCSGTNSIAYIIPTVSGATSYNWNYDGNNATINGSTENITVDFASNATNGNLSVTASNSCGTSSARTTAITVNSAPAQPSGFTTSSTTVCSGANSVAYIIPTVSNATSYTWGYTGSNATINGSTESITVDFASNATNGNLSVTATNSCGTSSAQTTPITVNSTPAQPSSFTTSSTTVCSGANSIAYTIPTVSSATSYNWNYDGSNATINGSTESITVDFASNATNGNLSVTASNSCGTSTAQTTAITVNSAPAQPSALTTSTTTLCNGTNGVIYAIPTASGATSYNWNYDGSNATINGSSESITVDFASNATSGTLSVTATNTCGTSSAQTTPITVNSAPAEPSSFTTSSATVCNGTNSVAYIIPSVSGATSYTWGYTGSNATINGSTESITVDFASNATNGNLSVAASNTCGTSSAFVLAITITNNLAASVSIGSSDADNIICSGTSIMFTATPTGGGSTPTYSWTVNGTTQSGETGSTFTTSSLASGAQVQVTMTSSASCATGSPASSNTITTTVNSLPTAPTLSATGTMLNATTSGTFAWYKDNTVIPSATASTYTATQSGDYKVKVTDANGCQSAFSNDLNVTVSGIQDAIAAAKISFYPNPTNGVLNIQSDYSETVSYSILNMIGKEVSSGKIAPGGNTPVQMEAKGVYLLKFSDASSDKVYRVVVE